MILNSKPAPVDNDTPFDAEVVMAMWFSLGKDSPAEDDRVALPFAVGAVASLVAVLVLG